MPFVTRFDTPGSLRDAPNGSALYDTWHRRVAGLLEKRTPGSGSGEFFDPSQSGFRRRHAPTYAWAGFPRPHLVVNHRDDREAAFRAGEDRKAQHEYLEWHVTRENPRSTRSTITKVTFVTETPEYWHALAETEPEIVLRLYRELVDRRVKRRDLFDAQGRYLPENPWNTRRGIVHYIMSINGISPLINAEQDTPLPDGVHDNYDAMPLRFDKGTGQPLVTAADARFSLDIGVLERQGLSVTVREPVGLYMIDWDDTGWTKPDGSPVGSYWRIVRGKPGAALRLEYEVPEREGFAVGDIRIGGRPVRYGGQLAEHITVMAGGLAGRRRPS
jgi:hypothetical protein